MLTTLIEAWIPQFTRSAEMFAGATVTQDDGGAAAGAEGAAAGTTWHQQTFERDGSGSGSVWVGASPDAVRVLTQGVADDEAGQADAFHELLVQSLAGAGRDLALADCPGLRCADGFGTTAPVDAQSMQTVSFKAGNDRLVLEIHVDRRAAALFDPPAEPAAEVQAPAASDLTLDRFVGVNLPVALVIGRATMRLRDVLQLRVGSTVELNKHASELVDVCVHDAVVARGEVVSVRGNYGVRILEVPVARDRDSAPTALTVPAGKAH